MSKYHPYPDYKESGVEWLVEIPEHWEIKKFKYLFQIKKRIAGKLGYDVLSITQKGIKVKDIESGAGQLSSDYSKYQHVRVGDYAMNHMDLLTGFVDLSQYDGVTSPDYRVFSLIHQRSSPEYYLYLLQMGYLNKLFYPFGQGSSHLGRWRLPTEAFNEFLAPYPPTAEQTSIANFLNQETTKIDTLIFKQEKMIELLAEKRISSIDNAIKHIGTKFMRFGTVTYQVFRPVNRMKDEQYISIGLYNRGRGLFHKPIKYGYELGDSNFYWIKGGDLILSGQFAWEGSVALAAEEENECIVSHRYPVIRGKEGVLNTEYLWAYLTTREGDFLLNEHSVGAAGRNRPLNINTLKKEKIPIPPIEAQKQVSKIVQKEKLLQRTIKQAIKLLKERRMVLISATVTGKIDVRVK